MKDARQEIGYSDSVQHKTPYIDELKANQSKVDTATAATADHPLIATSVRGRVANKACVSEKLQQKIRAQAAKFVQNADVQEQAKKRRATQTDNSQPITKKTRQKKE